MTLAEAEEATSFQLKQLQAGVLKPTAITHESSHASEDAVQSRNHHSTIYYHNPHWPVMLHMKSRPFTTLLLCQHTMNQLWSRVILHIRITERWWWFLEHFRWAVRRVLEDVFHAHNGYTCRPTIINHCRTWELKSNIRMWSSTWSSGAYRLPWIYTKGAGMWQKLRATLQLLRDRCESLKVDLADAKEEVRCTRVKALRWFVIFGGIRSVKAELGVVRW